MSKQAKSFTFPRIRLGEVLSPCYAQWLFLLFTLNCLVLQSQLVHIAWHGGHTDYIFIASVLGALSMAALLRFLPTPHTRWATLLVAAACSACGGWLLSGMLLSLLPDLALSASLNGVSPDIVMRRLLLSFSSPRELLPHVETRIAENFALVAGLFWSTFLLISLGLQTLMFVLPFEGIRKRFWMVRLAYGCIPIWFMNFSGYPVFSPGYGTRFLAEALDYAVLLAQRYLATATDILLAVLLRLVDVPSLLPPLPKSDRFSAWSYPAEEWAWFLLLLAAVPFIFVFWKRLGKDCAWTPTPNTAV